VGSDSNPTGFNIPPFHMCNCQPVDKCGVENILLLCPIPLRIIVKRPNVFSNRL